MADDMNLEQALQEVLKNAIAKGGVVSGLNKVVKTLEQNKANFCVLAENCDDKTYVALIESICNEKQVTLIKFPDNKKLGELIGQCKIDREGKPRKVVAASCVVVNNTGDACSGLSFLQDNYNVRATPSMA